MEELIGRKKEAKELKQVYLSRKAEFVAIYGRRRVGKTFLLGVHHITYHHLEWLHGHVDAGIEKHQ